MPQAAADTTPGRRTSDDQNAEREPTRRVPHRGPSDRTHERFPDIAPAPTAKTESEASTKAPARRKRLLAAGVAAVVVLAGAGWYGEHWWTVGRFQVATDNAYVGAKNATLAAKVGGYVAGIAIDDNAQVKAGSVIATIDDGDYRLAAEQARGKVSTQQATVARLDSQVRAQQALSEQAKAQLVSARAAALRADLELARQQSLAVRE